MKINLNDFSKISQGSGSKIRIGFLSSEFLKGHSINFLKTNYSF